MRRLRLVIALVFSLTLAFPAPFGLPGVLAETAAPVEPAGAAGPDLALPSEPAFRPEGVRQGYDLLLDRYVQPVSPSELLQAAFDGVVQELAEAGVSARSGPPLHLEASREAAWSGFVARLEALLQESPPPAGFTLTSAALTAMARYVDEGHTVFLSPQQYRDFQSYLRGDQRYGGIGLRPTRPGVTVAEIFPGSPAAAAGLLPGDRLTSIDGVALDGKSLEQAAQLIRGPEGTTVTVTAERPRTGHQLSLDITRAMIKIEYVYTDVLYDNIAYIRVRGFPEPSVAERFEQFLDSLPSLRARGLIIDLRGNSGGRVDVGTRLLNRFITSGPLYEQVDRGGRRRGQVAVGPGTDLAVPRAALADDWVYVATAPGGQSAHKPLPIVILIDEGTASMGEIFAQSMQDRGLAYLIGKTTSGNVAAAQVFPLTDGSALQVTILEIYSGQGARLNRVGVTPDLELSTTPEQLEGGRDVPLESAVIHLWEASTAKSAQ